jgi:nitrate reductase gamma subunit
MKALSPSGSNNLWSAVSMLVLATVAIALRFMIRISTRLHVTWSDTFMLLSLASFAVFGAFNIDCEHLRAKLTASQSAGGRPV